MNLVNLLVQAGVLPESDVPVLRDKLAAAAGSKPMHLVMLEQGFIREEDLLPVLAEYLGMELVDLTKATVDPDTLKAMPLKLVHRRSLMPLSRENGTLVVATGDPFDVYALDELQTLTGLHIQPVLASPREIARLIKTHFGVGGETVTALVQERDEEDVELLEGHRGRRQRSWPSRPRKPSVVKLVNEILIEAANERASDIHIEPERRRPAHPLPHRRPAADADRCRRRSTASRPRSSAASRSWPG